ncbi:efflux RND transporter periplasmic adaptor subunit [Aquimarina brevivitae]|uniref:RND family efflux transporter MFP subunit n=1 Tax=Aquimarina brevivitae TaxID=323412 RepID=A0A4Q7P1N6_9FLAO|nr:efflux RND transporter periplasmic adaptor subunit [Aquimarina brevivitae]RZS93635.1 RND family efflux transporter MFP subunit [Aquimarina brevivitae]
MKLNKKSIIIICIIIFIIALGAVWLIFSTEPEAQSEGATKKSAMLVSVVNAEKGNFVPQFLATGTVQPVEDIQLNAIVSGQILYRSSDFIPGGIVKKGETLLKIDPADFINQVELRKSELLQAKTNLELEMGRQVIAEQDLALVGVDSLSDKQKSLILRKPQLNAVKATIQSAQAAYDQAQLNLQRTTIRAPFDAQVISQNVTVGSLVGPQNNLGRLVGTAAYWVTATIPVHKLQWLSFAENNETETNEVRIKNVANWGQDNFRTGILYRQIGALEEQTRLVRVLIKVEDPLSTLSKNQNKPKMIIGSFVEIELSGKKIKDVVRIHRDYLRSNQTVWIMEDGTLQIKNVSILLSDANYVYITEGLSGNEKIVTTNISTVTNGVPLRTEE